MRRDSGTLVKAAFATVLAVLSLPVAASAQDAPTMPPPYNPYPPLPGYYPPSILPPNLNSELVRVEREVKYIFNQYYAEYQALSPTPTYMGNPPILVPNGYDAQRILGGLLQYDLTMSPFENVACASCHSPNSQNGPHTATLEEHTHHPAGSPGSQCVACHMPKILPELPGGPFVATHTFHFITPAQTDS